MVVVLIPPAVDPGLPPINIKMMVRSQLFSDSFVRSTVLNPAVLGVMALKKEAKTFPAGEKSAKSL